MMTDDRDYDALAADIAESEGNGDLAHALHQLSQVKAKLAAAERRERQLLDTTATCRMLRREFNTLKAKLAEVEAERDAFASNIPDAAQNLIRNAHTGRLKALHRAEAAEARIAHLENHIEGVATILAALEPDTPLDDLRVLALVEGALKEAERMLKHYGSRDAGGMAQIRAALEAIASPSIATPLDDPLVKALVEAAIEVKADCIARADKHGVVPIGRGAWDQLTDALEAIASPSISALEENK